jgi:hypothetical protein
LSEYEQNFGGKIDDLKKSFSTSPITSPLNDRPLPNNNKSRFFTRTQTTSIKMGEDMKNQNDSIIEFSDANHIDNGSIATGSQANRSNVNGS